MKFWFLRSAFVVILVLVANAATAGQFRDANVVCREEIKKFEITMAKFNGKVDHARRWNGFFENHDGAKHGYISRAEHQYIDLTLLSMGTKAIDIMSAKKPRGESCEGDAERFLAEVVPFVKFLQCRFEESDPTLMFWESSCQHLWAIPHIDPTQLGQFKNQKYAYPQFPEIGGLK